MTVQQGSIELSVSGQPICIYGALDVINPSSFHISMSFLEPAPSFVVFKEHQQQYQPTNMGLCKKALSKKKVVFQGSEGTSMLAGGRVHVFSFGGPP